MSEYCKCGNFISNMDRSFDGQCSDCHIDTLTARCDELEIELIGWGRARELLNNNIGLPIDATLDQASDLCTKYRTALEDIRDVHEATDVLELIKIDEIVNTALANSEKPNTCPYCLADGYHKLSCESVENKKALISADGSDNALKECREVYRFSNGGIQNNAREKAEKKEVNSNMGNIPHEESNPHRNEVCECGGGLALEVDPDGWVCGDCHKKIKE